MTNTLAERMVARSLLTVLQVTPWLFVFAVLTAVAGPVGLLVPAVWAVWFYRGRKKRRALRALRRAVLNNRRPS